MFLEEMADGEPQRRWPAWYMFVPAIYQELNFTEPYSYVVLPFVIGDN